MHNFDKNIEILKKTNPKLVNKLLQIKENQRFEVFATKNKDYNILDTKFGITLYQNSPQVSIEKRLKELQKYKFYKTLYFYGIGSGELYKKLTDWNFKTVYIIEPEIEMIYIALNLYDFSKELTSKKIAIIYSEDADSKYFSILFDGTDNVNFKTYTLNLYSDYYEIYFKDISRVNREIIKNFSYLIHITGNDATDELTGLKHFIQNIELMVKNLSLKELKNSKNSNTAIIVATGPSLHKQLKLLKKIHNRVTIICVDASLPILEKENIKPDIVTSIERVKETALFYKKTSKSFKKGIIFSISTVAHNELIKNIDEGYLQLNMRPKKYFKFFGLDDWGYIGSGMSAANLAYELASFMEFEKIILIGQDLAYGEDGESHTKNHIFGENEITQDENMDEFILGYGGKSQVKTTKIWKLFLRGYEKTIAQNNINGNIITINATEGGARINGTIEKSFLDITNQIITENQIKNIINFKTIQNSKLKKYLHNIDNKINSAISLGESMIKQCYKLHKDISTITKKYDNKTYFISEKDSKKMIDKIQKVRVKYYNSEFSNFYEMLLSPLITHLEYDIAYFNSQPEEDKEQLLGKRWKLITIHEEWCKRVIINTEAILKILTKNRKLYNKKLEYA